MSLSAALGNKAPLPKFVDGDRAWEVSYLTQGKKAAFERWLIDRARKLLMEWRKDLPPEEWEKKCEAFEERVDTGYYGFHDKIATAALARPSGVLALAAILFSASEDDLMDLVERRGEDLKLFLNQIRRESAPRERPKNEQTEEGK
jgi:hypothetical protein